MDKLGIHSIDHIVIQAVDVLDTIKFYTEILGMTHSEFQPPTGGPVRQSLHFGAQKINLHDAGSPFRPHAKNPAAGSVDLCFITCSLNFNVKKNKLSTSNPDPYFLPYILIMSGKFLKDPNRRPPRARHRAQA